MLTEAADFRSEVLRTADRLRGLSPARLERDRGGESIAVTARTLIERIVATSSGVAGRTGTLPQVRAHGLADQLAVVGAELADLAETQDLAGLADLAGQLRELRRST